jgi:hypothetical protein
MANFLLDEKILLQCHYSTDNILTILYCIREIASILLLVLKLYT